MPTALVVDDSKVDQRLVAALLAKRPGLAVACADNGREALEAVAAGRARPDPDGHGDARDGRAGAGRGHPRQYPAVPIVVMTAHGSEDAAAEALRRGASSYVPKRFLARDLMETVDRVLGVASFLNGPGPDPLAGRQPTPPTTFGRRGADSWSRTTRRTWTRWSATSSRKSCG